MAVRVAAAATAPAPRRGTETAQVEAGLSFADDLGEMSPHGVTLLKAMAAEAGGLISIIVPASDNPFFKAEADAADAGLAVLAGGLGLVLRRRSAKI